MKNELFIIPPETIRSMDREAVEKTVLDMYKLNLLHLPYPKVDVLLYVDSNDYINRGIGATHDIVHDLMYKKAHAVQLAYSTDSCLTLRFVGLEMIKPSSIPPDEWPELNCSYFNFEAMVLEGHPPKFKYPFIDVREDIDDRSAQSAEWICKVLIVLLATRGTKKTVTENKLAKLGIGKRKKQGAARYGRVTTISLADNLPDDPEHATVGKPKCPHMRRGHIRQQHYGPKNVFIKQVWIEPCFVNADTDFVSKRERYNVAL